MKKPQQLALDTQTAASDAKIMCLGRTFPSEDARREWFRDQLRAKLKDPEFRARPGFPKGSDDDLVAMSDPPWYTACPNPWVEEFITRYGRPYDPSERYHRDPFAVDVVEKKTGLLYQAHGYHTKVPYLAILPLVLHYTKPGDVILDGFCGSGMAGVAAQWCATEDMAFRGAVEKRFKDEQWDAPEWGARRAVLNDLAPAATFIASNYNIPFDVPAFQKAANELLDEVDAELGWMYRTRHTDGRFGKIEYTVWSEVFQCGACSKEIVFADAEPDEENRKKRKKIKCPHCQASQSKDALERIFETAQDPYLHETVRRIRLKPIAIRYTVGHDEFSKEPDGDDLALIDRVAKSAPPADFPTKAFPLKRMSHGSRLGPKGVTHVHHLFLPRARHALALMWKKANAQSDQRVRLHA